MTVSSWLDLPHVPNPPLRGVVSADVVIIGADLCGAGRAGRKPSASTARRWR